ncbi:MAG: beta-aspartyl-peptidase [Desulfobacteraceae bacterium 4572_89]|nr:MAG: beta-aspartyl-peptidase [Desulfobacteraceae bacterium 4572_89]
MILICNANVFGPEELGKNDVLIGGNQILAIEKKIDPKILPGKVRRIDASGMFVVPGFIDGHQHFTGGGGEGGFQSKTPEMQLSMNIVNGVTTAVGLLGTDCLTRNVENLYAKTQAFNAEGITALMLTGSYWLPSPTICGSVGRDMVYLSPVIGVKLAMADHRGPVFDEKDLATLASEVRVAALIAAKPGVITVHMGMDSDGLDRIFGVEKKYAIRPDMFVPTHVNRKNSRLQDQSLELAAKGAVIDATCINGLPKKGDQQISAAEFACLADENDLFDQVSFSSDADGSQPRWNADRTRLLGMGMGTSQSLLFELKQLVQVRGMGLAKALQPLTTTPARAYGLTGQKGKIVVGAHADILVLDGDTLGIRDVLAKGQVMMQNQKLEKKGYYE